MIFNMTGGGTPLNFKIVGNPQPDNPRENTIWIDTDVPISSWLIDTAQPETASEGMLLLYTARYGTVSFNAIKKNGITITPTSAKQYVNGVWEHKPAMIWQGGAWKEFATWLYVNGNECKALTGGWEGRGWAWDSSTGAQVPFCVNEAERLAITMTTYDISSGAAHILKDIDLTNVSTLTIDYELNGESHFAYLMVLPRNTAYMENATKRVSIGGRSGAESLPRQSKSLDVSDLSGMYDVAIAFNTSWTGTKTLSVYLYGLRAD